MAVVCIQLKRGMSASWIKQNPILAMGEPGFEKDTGKLKIGDGFSPWLDLDYVGEDGTGVHNAATHLDFPSVGKSNIIYKAYEEQKLYQWNDDLMCYEVLIDLSQYATQAYVQDLIDGMQEGAIDMIALTTEEILDICK